ncbi:MAG: tetratricopeptide repeat protein [Candidatus Aminicenantaceae bacterium]
MKLKRIFVKAALLIFVFAAFGLQNSSDHKVLFEKAKYTMETKGDLSAAIKLFEEIIQKYPDQREYAAKSQLYIGFCYEKLGLQQAQAAFQKVVDNYSEQAEAVKMANKKLSVLAKAQSVVLKGDTGLKVRQLLSGPELLYDGWLGAVSPDGRYVSIVDWETGDLAIRDLTTGKKQQLTDQKNEEGYALYSTWSPDGKRIVYDWWHGNSFIDLRIIGIEEKKPHTVLKNEEIEYAWPLDWFPDGEHILIALSKDGLKSQMAVLSLKDKTTQIIPLVSKGNAYVSPDGRYIAYHNLQEQNVPENDIYLYSIEERKESLLIEHPANDGILGWSPDGQWILFRSSRLGSDDAWIVPVSNGKADGDPRLVKKGIGDIASVGFSRDGSLYYMSSKRMEDIYKASLNPETGEIQNPPEKMDLPSEGRNDFPVYSPDGKKLAYIRGSLRHYGSTLHIRSLESGKEKIFPLSMKALYPRWSPGGRAILVSGITESRLPGIYRIDIQTGDVKPVLLPKSSKKEGYRFCELTPDGKSFFYIQAEEGKSNNLISKYNFETEKKKKIHQTSYAYAKLSLSPDGRWLAFIGRELEKELKIIPADGGEPRVICRFNQRGAAPISLAWTPDSQYILFFKQKDTEVLGKELCRVSVAGGELQELGLSMISPDHLRMHPNGHEIVFSSLGFSIPYPEYWVMENFLPKEKSPKK